MTEIFQDRPLSKKQKEAEATSKKVDLQLLLDTGINGFAVKLLIESFKRIKPEVKAVLPVPLDFVFDGVRIIIEEKK